MQILIFLGGDNVVANKSDTVRWLLLAGEYKKALNIAKGFKIGIKKEDMQKMAKAYECLIYPNFYEQLGTDIDTAISEGIRILKALYGQGEENS